jgi:DNA-binding transcriptional LysR family regulator
MPRRRHAPSPISWDDLRYFLAAARAGSLVAAGSHLGVDHTTVGRRLKSLEGRLGATLFDRNSNRLRLTPEGLSALADVEGMEAITNSLWRRLGGSDDRVAGEIRLSIGGGLALNWLIPALRPFLDEHQDLSISWLTADSPAFDVTRDADLAILTERPTETQLVARKLGSVKLATFATAPYVARWGVPTSLDELNTGRLLQLEHYERLPALEPWNALTRSGSPVFRLSNAAAVNVAVETNAVVALLPGGADQTLPGLTKLPIDLGLSIDYWLVFHEDRRQIVRLRSLAEEIYRLARESSQFFE